MNINRRCIFCGNNGPYKSVEHIIPEGLGNDNLILEGRVCDTCNQYFGSKVENYVLRSTPIGIWRVLLRINGKKRSLPKFKTLNNKKKGRLSKVHKINDIFSIECHKDGTTSIDIPDHDIVEIMNGNKTSFKISFTPYMVSMVGRFLLKIGLELLCYNDIDISNKYNEARKYARYGNANDIWPLFHFSNGDVNDLIQNINKEDHIYERVFCYQFNLINCYEYELLAFQVGTDVFVICLNDQYPSPKIQECFVSSLKIL